ncbi:DUF3558 domain-containing protein [Streptomyces sp. NPDC050560]|uniref:DUF3558 domain-containing protein n=1 Tax=Streptomyces sp. NPDC050560 TaxID=3365630 RepID=UPI0037AAE414
MHPPAQRLTRLLVCAAAVPVILAAAGCSSGGSGGSDDGDAKGGGKSSAAASASPTAPAKAAYSSLPAACDTVSAKTLDSLVPEADSKKGKEGESADTGRRASCSWDSLDNNGVKGSQFRWLNVSLLRFDSDTARGTGNKQATEYYTKQIDTAKATEGATDAKDTPVADTGDQATAVSYDLKKKEGAFKQQTVVVRVENVVVTVDYDGAGLAGDKAPDADDLAKDAQRAAKDAVAAVEAVGKGGGSDAPSDSPSGSSSKKPGGSSSSEKSDKSDKALGG